MCKVTKRQQHSDKKVPAWSWYEALSEPEEKCRVCARPDLCFCSSECKLCRPEQQGVNEVLQVPLHPVLLYELLKRLVETLTVLPPAFFNPDSPLSLQ